MSCIAAAILSCLALTSALMIALRLVKLAAVRRASASATSQGCDVAELGSLYQAHNRIRQARDLVSSVYFRFCDGLEKANLQSAKLLLDEWT
jgi:hypothetical protein